jgi:hypothetical protein
MTDRRLTLCTLVGLFVALALFATSCGGGSTETTAEVVAESTSAPTSDAAEDTEPAEASVVATTVDGGQIDFGSLQGQDVVLWFWAPW